MEREGSGLTRGEGKKKKRNIVGKQQIEMGKVSNGMN